MAKCYFNIFDEKYYVADETGLVWGIGNSPEEAIEEAIFWGLDCKNVEFEGE